MTLRAVSPADIIAAIAAGAAGFALGYFTPFIGAVIVLVLLLLLFDAVLGTAGDGPGSQIVLGLAKLATLACSPLDSSTNAPGRVWLWRAPAIATLAGFLLAWGQTLITGDA
jgi:hypothetical protein